MKAKAIVKEIKSMPVMARRYGEPGPCRDAVLYIDYFGEGSSGLRFRGETDVEALSMLVWFDPTEVSPCRECNCFTHTLMPGHGCGKCGTVKNVKDKIGCK